MFSDYNRIKLEINNTKVSGITKYSLWGKEEVSRKITKYFKLNKKTYPDLWDAAKAMLRRKTQMCIFFSNKKSLKLTM